MAPAARPHPAGAQQHDRGPRTPVGVRGLVVFSAPGRQPGGDGAVRGLVQHHEGGAGAGDLGGGPAFGIEADGVALVDVPVFPARGGEYRRVRVFEAEE